MTSLEATAAQKGPRDYYLILLRRKWQFAVPAALLFLILATAAFLWPATYQSRATILIEEPDVPRDLVSSTITSFADQRLQVITQRVMTTQNLIGIINDFGLYRKQRERAPINALVESLRNQIALELISADVVDPRSGRPTQATIAFTLSFLNASPETAQRVLNELVSLYLSENLRTRREKAAETTEFLANESRKLQQEVDQLEQALAEFKLRHAGSLPEQMAVSLQLMDRTERESLDVRRRVQDLEERKIYLQSELAQISPHDSFLVDGQRVISPTERLRALETRFIGLRGVYGEKHPDVVKLSREIEALQLETGSVADPAELELQLSSIETDLAVAQQKYAADHPDIVRLLRQRETLRVGLEEARAATPTATSPDRPDNPAYIQLQAQLDAVISEQRSLVSQQQALDRKLRDLESRVLAAPQIEREYLLLQRNYDNTLQSYQDVKAKQSAAELGQALETERKSERFSLIEPADLPLQPVKPNRTAILVLGFVFSVAVGIAFMALFEALDQSIYGARQLAEITGAQPLVVLPPIRNRADSLRVWRNAGFAALGAVAAVAGSLYLVETYLMPLDVLWSIGERRLADYIERFGGA